MVFGAKRLQGQDYPPPGTPAQYEYEFLVFFFIHQPPVCGPNSLCLLSCLHFTHHHRLRPTTSSVVRSLLEDSSIYTAVSRITVSGSTPTPSNPPKTPHSPQHASSLDYPTLRGSQTLFCFSTTVLSKYSLQPSRDITGSYDYRRHHVERAHGCESAWPPRVSATPITGVLSSAAVQLHLHVPNQEPSFLTTVGYMD